MDWFLYDNGLRHERLKLKRKKTVKIMKAVPLNLIIFLFIILLLFIINYFIYYLLFIILFIYYYFFFLRGDRINLAIFDF